MSCLRVRVVLCVDGIDLSVLKSIALEQNVFGGELMLVMRSACIDYE